MTFAYIWRMLALIFILTVIQRYACLYLYYPLYIWTDGNEPIIKNPFLIGKFLQFFAFIALPILFSIIIHLLLKWYNESYIAKQVIAQQRSAELDYLKAQINPHFLFNTLNNLYGLSLESNKRVPDLILKLSDVLSYSLYESSKNSVNLENEISLIKNFVDLEKERYDGRIKIHWAINVDKNRQAEIAPLLLIPFVENAFKHGAMNTTHQTEIIIKLLLKNNILTFEVINDINYNDNPIEESKSGLGLENLKRRLELVYSNSFTLNSKVEDSKYYAFMKIDLNASN
jgi:LytS/YehU family sensor histidine kinase